MEYLGNKSNLSSLYPTQVCMSFSITLHFPCKWRFSGGYWVVTSDRSPPAQKKGKLLKSYSGKKKGRKLGISHYKMHDDVTCLFYSATN